MVTCGGCELRSSAVTAGVAALVFAVSSGGDRGWGSWQAIAGFVELLDELPEHATDDDRAGDPDRVGAARSGRSAEAEQHDRRQQHHAREEERVLRHLAAGELGEDLRGVALGGEAVDHA